MGPYIWAINKFPNNLFYFVALLLSFVIWTKSFAELFRPGLHTNVQDKINEIKPNECVEKPSSCPADPPDVRLSYSFKLPLSKSTIVSRLPWPPNLDPTVIKELSKGVGEKFDAGGNRATKDSCNDKPLSPVISVDTADAGVGASYCLIENDLGTG